MIEVQGNIFQVYNLFYIRILFVMEVIEIKVYYIDCSLL